MRPLFALAIGLSARSVGAALSEAEQTFVAVPSNASAREHLQYITSEPHVAGTSGDAKMAMYVQDQMLAAGIEDVTTWELTVTLNYPNAPPKVELTDAASGALLFAAALSEDVLAEDSTSDTPWRNLTFNGYAPSGDVSGEAVYANYGRPEDFDVLAEAGVDVAGKVVLARYGACFRGLKAMNAQARGAAAVLIFSDPQDDGYGQGTVYPEGPWRPAAGVQRGSAQFLSLCAGDPFRTDARYLHPDATFDLCGYNATDTIPAIPVLPLSYGDAEPLLAALGGAAGPPDFQGGIQGLTYTLGPSEGKLVHVFTDNDMVETPIWDVVATIPGTLPPDADQPVLLGNHRDAWVFGAADPNSGTAALLELARGFGALLEQGWRPKRTIKLLSWSGEEYGLLGSTGWAELNPDLLTRASAYLNVDVAVSGDVLSASASPSLATLWRGVLADLGEAPPEAPPSVGAGAIASADVATTETTKTTKTTKATKATAAAAAAAAPGSPFGTATYLGVAPRNGPLGEIIDSNTNRPLVGSASAAAASHAGASLDDDSDVGTLGSGSDYTVFLDHLGIASLDFSFTPGAAYGTYHSIYDSFDWMDRFGGDPTGGSPGAGFSVMAAAARVWGVLAMRLADEPLAPFDHAEAAAALRGYLEGLEARAGEGLDLSGLTAAIDAYGLAAAVAASDCASVDLTDATAVEALNDRLTLTERRFLAAEGLPQRPWFKHTLQAPGLYLGYAAEAFPGVRQALDEGDEALAQSQADVAAARVAAAAAFLATGTDLEGSTGSA